MVHEVEVFAENKQISDSILDFKRGYQRLNAGEEDLPANMDVALNEFYANIILPEIEGNLKSGTPTYEGFGPKSRAESYLQYTYLAKNSEDREHRSSLIKTDGGTAYEAAHAAHHAEMKFLIEKLGYYDLFLIDHESGDIVYTVRKESDFGTNIFTGPYRNSGLAQVAELIQKDPTLHSVHMSDLKHYLPSDNSIAAFVGATIYHDGEVLGILALQMTVRDIDRIMTSNGSWRDVGLKESGETYLVGSDYLMRSNSRFAVENFEGLIKDLEENDTAQNVIDDVKKYKTTILINKVKTEGSEAAFRGETDTRIFEDYRGIRVLSAYTPLKLLDHEWALLAEIDEKEAFAPVTRLMFRTLITTGIVVPLSALAAIFLAGFLMRPSREMRDTAKAFIGGQEDIRFQDQGHDEWGQLGQSLNAVLDESRNRLSESKNARNEVRDIIRRLMPNAIGERFEAGERRIVSHSDNVTAAAFFILPDEKMNDADDPLSSRDLYETLDDRLDELATREGVDMLNQAGMHYIGFCGLTAPMKNHAERVFRFCSKVDALVQEFNDEVGTKIQMIMAIDSGQMFGALIGNYSMAYEVWGDAMNNAFNLARFTPVGAVTISENALSQMDDNHGAKKTKMDVPGRKGLTVYRLDSFR